ncbi:MAG: dihydroorotate dehydrogenase electron transfer subunit [Woeseiaceae bacterium]
MTAVASTRTPVRRHRSTIFVEDSRVIAVTKLPGSQYVLRLHAPQTARAATAGSFIHLQCDIDIPMRRPLSIMRANADDGWIEVLFKIVGIGLRSLGRKQPDDVLSVLGPIGKGFTPERDRPRVLLIGGGVGIPPMIFLADTLRRDAHPWEILVLMGSEIPFPFELVPSALSCDWLAGDLVSAMPLLEGWGIPSRLASLSEFRGSFRGNVAELARLWLQSQSAEQLGQTAIFTCGPTPMLEAVAFMAQEFGVPCQAALEEYMACAVGGCAGCTVLVQTETGPAMKRVCVDGPVFDAATVFVAPSRQSR